jgi:SAM-dependent methyltransferase
VHDDRIIIRSMWHGSPLSIYENLSLMSYLRVGHEVELYAYEQLDVPVGVRLRDAREVLPESHRFAYETGWAKGSFAAFSNLFRFKLLYEKGGVWVDLDTLCLKPLDTLPQNCAATEGDQGGLNQAVLRFSAHHPVVRAVARALESLGTGVYLGKTAELLTSAINGHPGTCEVLPTHSFYPLQWPEAWLLLDPRERDNCEKRATDSYVLHWWNGVLTLGIGLPKTSLPPVGSYLFEQAAAIFESSDLPSWPVQLVNNWIDNYKSREQLVHVEAELSSVRSQLVHVEAELSAVSSQLAHVEAELPSVRSQLAHKETELAQVLGSTGYTLLHNGRRVVRRFAPWGTRRGTLIALLLRGIRTIMNNEVGAPFRRPPREDSEPMHSQELRRTAWDSIGSLVGSPYLENATFLSIYDRFCNQLPPSASVLDLGCGTGVPISRDLIERGFEVVGVDFSSEMVSLAMANCPDATFLTASMTDIDFEDTFDGVLAISSMLSLRQEEFRATARVIARALKPNGYLLVTLNEPIAGVQAGVETYVIGTQTVYARAYTENEVRQAFAGLGMKVETVDREVITSELYGREHMIAFVMSKLSSR